MILGPTDGSSTINRELTGLSRILDGWFSDRAAQGLEGSNQGWLEYLYGIILARGKTESDAREWLIRSVRLCPYNWGAWLELNDLLNSVEEVGWTYFAMKMNSRADTSGSYKDLCRSYRKIS